MKLLPKVIIIFFLIFVVSNSTKKAYAAPATSPEISVYLSASPCLSKQMLTKPNELPEANTATLNVCIDGGTANIKGFNLEIICSNAFVCSNIREGADANKFEEIIDPFVSVSNTLTGSRILTNSQIVTGTLHIATFDLEIKQRTGVSIKFNRTEISPTNVHTTIYNLTEAVGTTGPGIDMQSSSSTGSTWVTDSEVTFVGKFATRSNDFLDWVLKHYPWSELNSAKSTNPFSAFWSTILKIVYALSLLLVLVSAFVMIATRGRNITIMRFIPRFIFVLVLATFSFALIQFIYQATDIIQGFFLRKAGGGIISAADLLNIDFGYRDFVGYRLSGATYDESVFVSLLLVKLTALTYYIMSGVLLVRKVILWFFIIVSPIFPFLLLYSPVRNTAKIWIGEFFRWLLYAPLFAIFLSGLVSFWTVYIPLLFNFNSVNKPADIVYPTAINILLGGPGQDVSKINSVNLPDTFVYYIVALLMLWAVIILPFILLRIFLDYLFTLSMNDASVFKQLINTNLPFIRNYPAEKNPSTPPSPITPVLSGPGAGLARSIPFINRLNLSDFTSQQKPFSQAVKIPVITGNQLNINQRIVERTKDILRSVNINVPTLRDIARYDASLQLNDIGKQEEVLRLTDRLERIVNPSNIDTPAEIHQYNNVKQDLLRESSSNNNSFAATILSAASKVVERRETVKVVGKLKQIMNPSGVSSPQERLRFTEVRNQLVRESNNNNSFAKTVLSAVNNISTFSSKEKQIEATNSVIEKLTEEKQKGNTLAATVLSAVAPARSVVSAGSAPISSRANIVSSIKPVSAFPVINRVQTVSLDDYEAVKEMWTDNYQKLEPPVNDAGSQQNRKDWINEDISKINETVNLITSSDPRKSQEGMRMVGEILPFLLIGGFSQTEIIAYLKAKLQAGKAVLESISQKEEEEETTVGIQQKSGEKEKEMEEEQVVDQKSEIKNQKGQSSIIIIFIILIGGLLFLQFIPKSLPDKLADPVCVNEPDSGITATYKGDTYYRIRGITAIPTGELLVHLENLGKAETISSVVRDAYTARMNGDNPISVTFDSGAKNLLFVEVSDLVKDKMVGYQYFEIYLKKGAKIPDFIQGFCQSNQPLSPRNIMSDSTGNSFPPISFYSDSIEPHLRDNTKYYLFSYEGKGSTSWNITMTASVKGSIKATSNGVTKTYTAYYNTGSSIEYIALIDDDPSSPDSQIAYKYSPMRFLSPFQTTTTKPVPTAADSLQLKTFSNLVVYPWGWWSPECKPAIYLYPTEKTNISVKVDPAGFLTYTDPVYPVSGWQVIAEPNGRITTNGRDYDYLYYESKIRDSEINKPKAGFVVAFNDLSKFYDQILPKLGLNKKETKDFKTYWEKVLPASNYYFIGIMKNEDIEKIEPLTVNPSPESIIRVRLYFEALDKEIFVKAPIIQTPQRNGYTLVEWGGLVKVDKNHPFTCSQ